MPSVLTVLILIAALLSGATGGYALSASDEASITLSNDAAPCIGQQVAKAEGIVVADVRCGASDFYCPDKAPACCMVRGRYVCCPSREHSCCRE